MAIDLAENLSKRLPIKLEGGGQILNAVPQGAGITLLLAIDPEGSADFKKIATSFTCDTPEVRGFYNELGLVTFALLLPKDVLVSFGPDSCKGN